MASAPAVLAMLLATVISPLPPLAPEVCIVTFVPALSAELISLTLTTAGFALGTKVGPADSLLVTALLIVTLAGSNSHVPA